MQMDIYVCKCKIRRIFRNNVNVRPQSSAIVFFAGYGIIRFLVFGRFAYNACDDEDDADDRHRYKVNLEY